MVRVLRNQGRVLHLYQYRALENGQNGRPSSMCILDKGSPSHALGPMVFWVSFGSTANTHFLCNVLDLIETNLY